MGRLLSLLLLSLFCLFYPLSASGQAPSNVAIGTIAGNFDVTLSGSAGYSIPIRIAPGAAGTEPKIALTYDSQAPAGALGAGWSISGISSISRGPKNQLFDQILDGVRLEESDALYLDGQRIVPILKNAKGEIEYRKEVDDQTRITRIGGDFNSASFRVETKGGLTILLDGSNNSRAKVQNGAVLFQAASKIVDTAGNYIEFAYRTNGNGDYNVESIRYTGHEARDEKGRLLSDKRPFASIDFTYEPAPRSAEVYVAGQVLRRDIRLKGITSRIYIERDLKGASETVARYELDYDETNSVNRFLLKRLHQFGEDGKELTATNFTYSEAKSGWTKALFQLPDSVILADRERLSSAYRFVHFAPGAGILPDILFAAQVDGNLEAFAFRNDSGTWVTAESFKPKFAFTNGDGADLGAVFADLNGDGRVDLLQSYSQKDGKSERQAFLAGNDGWIQADNYKLPFDVSRDGKSSSQYRFARWTGAAGPDLLYQTDTAAGFLANTGSGWRVDNRYEPPLKLGPNVFVLDVDCSGKPALVGPGADSNGNIEWRVFQFGNGQWDELTARAFKPPFSPEVASSAILEVALDGSGCAGLVVATAQNGGLHGAFIASKTGWHPVPNNKVPKFDLVDAAGHASGAVVADVNGDGRSDVIAIGGPTRFVFLQTSTGWEQGDDTFLPPASSMPQGTVVSPFVGDIDGDRIADIILPGNSRTTFGSVFVGSSKGFVEQPSFVPPVAFARKDRQDRGVRFADLNGDGLPDVLFRRDVAKDGKTETKSGAFINTGHGWIDAPGLYPPLPITSDNINGDPTQLIDVDGDGYVDLLYSYRDKNNIEQRHFFRNVVDGNGVHSWKDVDPTDPVLGRLLPPSGLPFAANKIGNLGVRFVDLRGTGRPDMLVGFLPPKVLGAPLQHCTTVANTTSCELNRGLFRVAAFLNEGNGWVRAKNWDPPLPFVTQTNSADERTQDINVQLIDVNQDGRPDIVARFKHPHDPTIEVNEIWLNNGDGWKLDKSLSVPVAMDLPYRDPNSFVQWADLNGDGLQDIILTRRDGGVNQSATWLSTGKGWVQKQQWQIPIDAISDRAGDPAFRLVDVDGDGYLDIIYARQSSNGAISKGLYKNTGSGWLKADSSLVPDLPFVDKDGIDQGVRLLDVDGNGLVDIVRSFAGSAPEVQVSTARRSDVLTKFDPGFGLSTSLFYQTMLEANPDSVGANVTTVVPWQRVYEPGSPGTYPVVSPVPATYLVRRVVVDEGGGRAAGFSYRYGDFRVHALAMRPLGFGWRESLNEISGVLTRTETVQDVKFASNPAREATCWIRLDRKPNDLPVPKNLCPIGNAIWSEWGQKLSETSNKWSVREGMVGAGSLPRRNIRQINLANSETRTFELDGSLTSQKKDEFQYDEPPDLTQRRLNALHTRTELSDGSAIDTFNEYDQDDPVRWFLGRLTKTIVRKSAGPEVETRAAGFTYDISTGLLSSQTSDLGHPMAATSKYEHDEYGNIVASSLMAAGEPTRTSRTVFDPLGRFAIVELNAIGQKVDKSLKLTTGLPISVVGPNQTITRYEYDGFGRVIKEISPSGIATRSEMFSADQIDDQDALIGLRAAYAVRTQTDNLPTTLQIFDNKARILRVVTEGFTADPKVRRPVQHDTIFDLLGRVVRASLPYERGKPPSWAYSKFDVLNRIFEKVAPNKALTKTVYRGRPGGGQLVTLTDPLGRMASTEISVRKLPLLVTDPLGASTQYEYDVGDRLTKIIGPTGSVTRHAYNEIGRRIQTNDPDMGTWRYEYDPFGHVVRQIDSKNQITSAEYDALGRLVRKITGDAVSTWTYDTGINGIGKIASMQGSDGYREQYFYDKAGNQARWAVTIGSETLVTSTDYDELGRVRKINYPDGFAVNNVYDEKGFLVAVRNARDRHEYWRALNIDALNHVTAEIYGNGIETVRSFEGETGRPREIRALGDKRLDVLDLKLKYDLVGNLQRRDEEVGNKHESFAYDSDDRLTGLSRPNGTVERYQYDLSGRITYKSNVGDYKYGPNFDPTLDDDAAPKPFHAVLVTNKTGSSRNYGYDLNGNMISGPQGRLEYNADNRLQLVFAEEDRWSRFVYAPSGNRYQQLARTGRETVETLYVGSYERTARYVKPLSYSNLWRLVRHRYYLANSSGVFASVESNEDYQDRSGRPIPNHGGKLGNAPGRVIDVNKTWYLHRDQLGSIIGITDESGRVTARFWYDPWGAREARIVDEGSATAGQKLGKSWARGFTGQESLDTYTLIHMNGRVYEPTIANFTSVDPLNQALYDSQAGNGYTYARNNPLRYVDPSGYGWFSDLVEGAGRAIGKAWDDVAHPIGQFFADNWKTIVIIVAVVVVTYFTAGLGTGAAYGILAGMAGGATGGALGAALYGGSLDDVLAGAVKGAVIGAFSSAIGYGIASSGLQGFEGYAAQGVGSATVNTVMGGGDFARNFAVGFISSAVAGVSSRYDAYKGSLFVRASVAAIVGGTISQISGGKFANGAVMGAIAVIAATYAQRALLDEGRPLTSGERQLVMKNFGMDANPYSVRLVDDTWNDLQDPTRPMSPNGNIYMGSAGCADFSSPLCSNTDTFIHEMTHVMQYQNGDEVLLRGGLLQLRDQLPGQDVYKYQFGAKFNELNLEQQGMYKQDQYMLNKPRSPYSLLPQ